jgi:Flp pilus assembly protein TadG
MAISLVGFSRNRSGFAEDRRGSVSIIFAFAIIPIIAFMGVAVDYGRLLEARTIAQSAADAAALHASTVALDLMQKTDSSSSANSSSILTARLAAEQAFKANLSTFGQATATVDINVVRSGQVVTATAAFTVSVPMYFGEFLGALRRTAAGTAISTGSMPLYTDLYMALDVSQSMGLAASDVEAKELFSLTYKKEKKAGNPAPTGCVFGCHVSNSGYLSTSYHDIAKEAGINLRIDTLKSAVTKTINAAETNSAGTGMYRIGLYTMSLASSNSKTYALNELSSIKNDFASLRSAAAKVDLGANNSGGTGDSFFTEQLNALRYKIKSYGDGTSQLKAKAYLMIVTDGLRDVWGSCGYGHCTAAFDPGVCTQFKNMGVTVVVIYTTFLPIVDDPNAKKPTLAQTYIDLVKPHILQIPINLKACASAPEWYTEASDGTAIDAAISHMFAQTLQKSRLTK